MLTPSCLPFFSRLDNQHFFFQACTTMAHVTSLSSPGNELAKLIRSTTVEGWNNIKSKQAKEFLERGADPQKALEFAATRGHMGPAKTLVIYLEETDRLLEVDLHSIIEETQEYKDSKAEDLINYFQQALNKQALAIVGAIAAARPHEPTVHLALIAATLCGEKHAGAEGDHKTAVLRRP